jgi:hypothetical protein
MGSEGYRAPDICVTLGMIISTIRQKYVKVLLSARRWDCGHQLCQGSTLKPLARVITFRVERSRSRGGHRGHPPSQTTVRA